MSKKKKITNTTVALTAKQKKFAEGILMGKSNIDAYINAYDTSNMQMPTIRRKAFDAAHNPKIVKFVEEFKDIYKEKVVEEMRYGRDELLHDFMYMRDKSREAMEKYGVKQATANAYINSLKEIGNLLSLYPDKKVDVNANIASCDFEINITSEEEIIEVNDSNDDDALEEDI